MRQNFLGAEVGFCCPDNFHDLASSGRNERIGTLTIIVQFLSQIAYRGSIPNQLDL